MGEFEDRSRQRPPRPRVAFAAPRIPQAPTGILTPANAMGGIDVYLPDDLVLYPGDRVRLGFENYAKYVPSEQRKVRYEASELGRHIGRTLDVLYVLARGGEEHESQRLSLTFTPLAAEDPLLPMPYVEQASAGSIDLRTFEGDAQVGVPPWPFFEAEQFIWIKAAGTMEDGSNTSIDLEARYVLPGDETGTYTTLPRTFLEERPNGSHVAIEMRVRFDGESDFEGAVIFPVAHYTLIREDVPEPDLPPPWVQEAVRDFIDPVAVPNGATACVAANPAIVEGARVTLFMHGTTLGDVPVGHEAFLDIDDSTVFPLSFVIPHEKIFVLGGSTADFGYFLDRPGGERLASRLHQYRIVSTIPSLPPPRVPKAEGDRLDPEEIDEHEGVEVDVSYPGIEVGDVVTLTWRGTRMTVPYSDTLTVFADSVSFFVPKVPFVTGNEGAEVGLEYVARYDDGISERSRSLVLKVEGEARPEILVNFEDVPDQTIHPEHELSLAGGKVILKAVFGLATIKDEGDRNAPYCRGRLVLVTTLSTLAFDLETPAWQVGLGFVVMQTGRVEILLYSEEGVLVGRRLETVAGGHWFEHEADAPVKRILVRVAEFARLDNLRLA